MPNEQKIDWENEMGKDISEILFHLSISGDEYGVAESMILNLLRAAVAQARKEAKREVIKEILGCECFIHNIGDGFIPTEMVKSYAKEHNIDLNEK